MKRKQLLVLSLSTLLSLTACGSSRYTEVNQPLPGDLPGGKTEIVFWECLGHEKGSNLGTVIEQFEAKYPQYKVKADKIAGGYDELNDAIKKKLAAGQAPALTMGYPDSFSTYMTKTITLSSILRLNTWIDDDRPVYPAKKDEEGHEISPASTEIIGYTEDELTGENGFVPGYYAEGNGYHFEGVWSMPMYKSTEAMYYNKNYFKGCNELNKSIFYNENYLEFQDLFDAVEGAAGPDADHPTFWEDLDALEAWCKDESKHPGKTAYTYDVPVTWNDAITLARKMQADRRKVLGYNTTTNLDKVIPFGYDSDANLMISQMEQRGIPYTKNDAESQSNPRRHFLFNNDQAKALALEIKRFVEDEKIMCTKNSIHGYTSTKFGAGEILFTVGSTGGSTYNISGDFAVGLAQVPYSNNNPKYIQQGPSICFFDNGNGYIHKGAWLFYKELAGVETNAWLALNNSYDPIRKKSYDTDYYQEWVDFETHPEYKGKLGHEIPKLTQTLKNYYMTSPVFIGSGEARNQMSKILENLFSGGDINKVFSDAENWCYLAAR